MVPEPTRDDVAALIDHTLLAPEATAADVVRLCREAVELGVHAVCISPTLTSTAAHEVLGKLAVATVIGFPSGAHLARVKAAEAAAAVQDGATELDMVMNLGLALADRWSDVASDIAAVRAAAPRPTVLKVIIEAGVIGEARIPPACEAAERSGADYVKTSTGFHPSGGATIRAVEIMAATVGGRLGVKASGGIHTAGQAIALIAAGATRLGASHSRAILEHLRTGRDS